MCFSVNTDLATFALSQLAAPPVGSWKIDTASTDSIADGCDGVLSWMLVEAGGDQPINHVLFFTNGTFLGTATPKPYSYTEVVGSSQNTVQVRYRWPKSGDPTCCPRGGSSVVTFTLKGATVQSVGQLPPVN
ncbi:hypothetical protein GCM10027167_71530 [Nocardia heshunensis]